MSPFLLFFFIDGFPKSFKKFAGGGGGLFDYSVFPGPFFWEFDTEFAW